MSESTLALTYDQIRQRVGKERGYLTDSTAWSAREKEDIEFCVRDGSAVFYTQSNYEWSFLTPLAEFTLKSGTTELDLPWDFGFPVDNVIYFDDHLGRNLEIVNDGMVLLKRQNLAQVSSRPRIAAVVTDGKPGVNVGQGSKLIFWPIADQDYLVQLRYAVLPNALTAATPIPYGGGAHAQTLLESCLAASERLDGIPWGPHAVIYAQALEASKAYDRRLKPRTIGKVPMQGRWMPRNINPVVYTGS